MSPPDPSSSGLTYQKSLILADDLPHLLIDILFRPLMFIVGFFGEQCKYLGFSVFGVFTAQKQRLPLFLKVFSCDCHGSAPLGKTVALSHGNLAVDHHIISVVDNTIDNCIGDRAVILGIGVDTIVPALRMILRTENDGLFDPRFNDLQQVKSIIYRQLADKPFVKDQQIDLFVCLDDLGKLIVRSCNCKLVKQFGQPDVTNGLELSAVGVPESAGDVGLAISRRCLW